MNLFFSLLPLLFLTACNPFMLFRADSEKLVTKGWASQPLEKKTPAPLYCYKTLATTMCYPTPKVGEHSRLVGYYGPQP